MKFDRRLTDEIYTSDTVRLGKNAFQAMREMCIRDSALAAQGIGSARFDFYGNGESDGEFEDMSFDGLHTDAQDIFAWAAQQPYVDSEKTVSYTHLGVGIQDRLDKMSAVAGSVVGQRCSIGGQLDERDHRVARCV